MKKRITQIAVKPEIDGWHYYEYVFNDKKELTDHLNRYRFYKEIKYRIKGEKNFTKFTPSLKKKK